MKKFLPSDEHVSAEYYAQPAIKAMSAVYGYNTRCDSFALTREQYINANVDSCLFYQYYLVIVDGEVMTVDGRKICENNNDLYQMVLQFPDDKLFTVLKCKT